MALFVDLVALSNGLHGSVQMDSVALFSWIGWLRHRGILIQSEKNGGYGYGNNCGIAFLKKNFDCDFILIANPDVIFEENVIQKMKDAFDEETVIVAPLTLDAKGNRQLPIAWKVPTIKDYYLFSSILFNKIFHSLDYPKDFYNQSVCYVDCV